MTFCGVAELVPIISIDPKVEHNIILRNLYYKPEGYYRTFEKMYDACKKAGYNFSLSDIKNWLNKQAIFQIHKPRPKIIPYASFINVTVPMEVIQADLCYMPHDKIGKKIYKYALNCVDIASRTKWTYPLTDRDSTSVAEGLKYLFNSRKCPLTWPKKFQTDGGAEFLGECHAMLINHGVKHKIAKSKRSMGIVEHFNLTLQKWSSYTQDAVEFRLPLNERCRAWVKDLYIFLNKLDNSVTVLINMSPAEARKKKHVYAKSSSKYNRPIGYDETLLPSYAEVRHLLEPGELEGGKKRATDCIWTPEVFTIESYLVQEGQPVLYKLYNGPKRSFVREELQIVPLDTELPPKYILSRASNG